MVALKDPNLSSDRQDLMNKLLDGLVRQLEAQQSQIFSLANRIKLQHNQRLSDANLFQEKISEMARAFATQEMERIVDAAKSDLLMGLKEREALIYKFKLEDTKIELADFIEWFHLLSHKCSEPKETPNPINKDEEKLSASQESDLMMLKSEIEKLSSINSALSSEKNFVWNQFKKMESDSTDQLRNKNAEVEDANEKMNKLLTIVEELQLLITEKDDTIITLKTNMAKLESDLHKKSEEISTLSRELELLKKSRSDSVTPVLRRCKADKGMSLLGSKVLVVKKDSSQDSLNKSGRNSKRKADDINIRDSKVTPSISETPKLFSSRFKVPKLKSPSPSVI